MSDKPSGYGRMIIGGMERPFHVGTEQADIFCRLPHRLNADDGSPLTLHGFGELFSYQSLRDHKLAPADLRDFVFSALKSGAEEDGQRVDFSLRMVAQWIDDADDHEVAKPFAEMLEQVVRRAQRQAERLKNAAPPPPTGAKKAKKKTAA